MSGLRFRSFHPGLDPSQAVMIDGHAPGFRTISHWPGHSTPPALRDDLTTGSCLRFAAMTESERRAVLGDFSVVTNNHYDADGSLSLFTMLQPEIALEHADLVLRAARSGDFAIFCGADALALELSIMCDLAEFNPFSTPPFDEERLGNLSRAYERVFTRMADLLQDPFALREKWETRYRQVLDDVDRVESGTDVSVTKYPEDDLAVIEVGGPITMFGLRLAATDLFRVLLVHHGDAGNRYRFCYRGESWWDVVSVRPLPRKRLDGLAARLDELEVGGTARWWATPVDWAVSELGFGVPVALEVQSARIDPLTARDPASSLSPDVVVAELRGALERGAPAEPSALSGPTRAP